jgi:hypothetical protein
MFDFVVMGVTFTCEQYVGFALLFCFYGISLTKFLVEQRVRKTNEPDDKFVEV